MKCLIIHGSPRRGNTWDVLNRVKEEMKRNGNFEFEVVELSKEKIPMCIGCFNCIKKGEKNCPHSSYIEPIVKKMKEADAFIITTPVYSMQVSGTLKNFIDHMSYNFHRATELSDKNINKIIKGAKVFSKELNSHKVHKPKLKSLIMFQVWRNLSKEDNFSIADFKYWNNDSLKESLYFEDIPVGVMKKLIASIFKKVF